MGLVQASIFDGSQRFFIDKPIRLIELFAGYGSQALALKYLGVPFEHWRISEWAYKSIQAYKDIHFGDDETDYSEGLTSDEITNFLFGCSISANYNTPLTRQQIAHYSEKMRRTIYNNIKATRNLGSICNIKAADLGITESDKYTYIMTYSFPCQDLSSAGSGLGMAKDSGTRSSLLWEVDRLLSECKTLPQVLLMENVPEVIGAKNMPNFAKWLARLENLGYRSKWKVLNATDFNVPQNRKRCFMVSVLGDYFFDFPQAIGCELRLKDVLEDKVDERYYLKEGTIIALAEHKARHEAKGNGFGWKPIDPYGGGGYFARTIKTESGYRPDSNFILETPREGVSDGDECRLPSSGERRKGIRKSNASKCGNGDSVSEGFDGIMLGTSEKYTYPPLADTSRSITSKGKNGVVEGR